MLTSLRGNTLRLVRRLAKPSLAALSSSQLKGLRVLDIDHRNSTGKTLYRRESERGSSPFMPGGVGVGKYSMCLSCP